MSRRSNVIVNTVVFSMIGGAALFAVDYLGFDEARTNILQAGFTKIADRLVRAGDCQLSGAEGQAITSMASDPAGLFKDNSTFLLKRPQINPNVDNGNLKFPSTSYVVEARDPKTDRFYYLRYKSNQCGGSISFKTAAAGD